MVLPHKLKDSGSFQLWVMVFPEHGSCPHAPEWKPVICHIHAPNQGKKKWRQCRECGAATWLHHFGQNLLPRPRQTAKEAWKWNDSLISCKVGDTLRTARIHCHRFCILRNRFFLFPVEWLLARNPETMPGIFRSQNFIDGIGSTGERRVDYSKCKSEAARNIARRRILASLEQEEQEEAELNSQGCLEERGTPMGSPGEDPATVQDDTESKVIKGERYWPFPFFCSSSTSSASH